MTWRTLLGRLYTLRYSTQRPVILSEQGRLALGAAPITFVIIVGPLFNQTIPNAGTTSRMGWCRGFEQLGIPCLFVSVFDLAWRLPEIPNPLCWISGWDYQYLSPPSLAALKRERHAVWVDTWFDGENDFYRQNDFQNNSLQERIRQKILSSEPALLFTISPECSFEYYQSWIRHGARLVSLPLACDTALYNQDAPFCPEFSNVQIAFVGGYWSYKARQFERYLKPYHDKLIVFGYSKWPYARYGGKLPVHKEPPLYRQARLSPTVNEPHVERMGVDLNERVFKVLGSGGLTITDMTPAYREWFAEDELLLPASLEEYHAMINQALTDDDFNTCWRQKGYNAVAARHTYVHRARALLDYFGIAMT